MHRARLAALALAALVGSGCFGSDRTFPDETGQVVRLHVNAYAETDPDPPRDVVVELSGLASDGEERAFEADLRIVLQTQEYDEPEPRYARVGEWSLHVDAPDFSSPTVAYFVHRIPEREVPVNGTYRVTAHAKLADGRDLSASALFHHPKANPETHRPKPLKPRRSLGRGMKPAHIEFHADHLALRLEGVHAAEALRRTVIVPYSTIGNAEVRTPEWPGIIDHYTVGAYVPGLVARGTFVEWNGRRRFLDIDRNTQNALTLKLTNHPDFDEVVVDLPDAGLALGEVAKHRVIAPNLPPVME